MAAWVRMPRVSESIDWPNAIDDAPNVVPLPILAELELLLC